MSRQPHSPRARSFSCVASLAACGLPYPEGALLSLWLQAPILHRAGVWQEGLLGPDKKRN